MLQPVLRMWLRSWLQSSQVHTDMWTQRAVRQLQSLQQSSHRELHSRQQMIPRGLRVTAAIRAVLLSASELLRYASAQIAELLVVFKSNVVYRSCW